MNLKVPAVFLENYIEELHRLNSTYGSDKVTEVYGSFSRSPIGNARASICVPDVNSEFLKHYIEVAHDNNIKFNYTLNSTCLGNREFNGVSHQQLMRGIEEIIGLGIDSITIAHPFLIQLVTTAFPEVEVVGSINLCANSRLQLSQLEDLGVRRVVVDRWINREFALLESLRKQTSVGLELLVNSGCVNHCILHQYHNNVNSHASQSTCQDGTNDALLKYPGYICLSYKLRNILRLICGSWIRPEDIEHYEAIGYMSFKTDLRGATEKKLLRVAEAYLARRYEGNLFYLLLPADDHPGLSLRKSMNMRLENQLLDGFIEPFVSGKLSCRNCSGSNAHCKSYARKLSYDNSYRQKLIEYLNDEVKKLILPCGNDLIVKEE
ncbi:MAG: hypothetical protein HF978_06540 [Desulfobacteraceae bacterium]|nr:U32 family peptidase [Desulfobacteraceae bacterium]MBC2755189.1 hypothetical protein [Desulfobacteraceae bacterium]